MSVPLLLALLTVLGAVIHRWWAVVLPLGLVPLYYAGLRNGWWGYGLGDGWQYAAILVTLIGLLCAAFGVAFGRLLALRFRRERRDTH